MNTNDLFVLASRKKFRYPYKGSISTEDLWDLSVNALDEIFKSLNSEYKKEADLESLLTEKPAANALLEAKISIIRYIVKVKQQEAADKEAKAANKAQKDKILEIIAAKKDQELQDLSVEDLMKKLNELG